MVATGVVRGVFPAEAMAFSSPLSPSPPSRPTAPGKVSLRPIKEFVRQLPSDHPLRVVVVSEPDEMDRAEYCTKLTVWLRLLPEDGR